MSRITEINLTQGHQFFQKEEGDISSLLSELEEGVSAMRGDEDSRQPQPVRLRRLVEEAAKSREAARRETHLTCVILLLTVHILRVSNLVYRRMRGRWHNLVYRRRTNSAPATRSCGQAHPGPSAASHNQQAERVDNPPDAVYPQSSGDVAATPNQRSDMASDDTAAAVESETMLYNAHGQIRVCERERGTTNV